MALATDVAAGLSYMEHMRYIHKYIHHIHSILHTHHIILFLYLHVSCRDVAARNCIVMQNLSVKITGVYFM